MSFICHIHNYTEYNEEWNVFSAFNPSKCTHTWSSGQPTLQRPGSSWGFGALLKGLTSVVDTSCQSRDSNLQPWVTSPTLFPLGHDCPHKYSDKKHPHWVSNLKHAVLNQAFSPPPNHSNFSRRNYLCDVTNTGKQLWSLNEPFVVLEKG